VRFATLLLFVVGCGSSSQGWSYQRLTRDRDRGDLVAVSCDGQHRDCYRGAAKACPGGFFVEDSQGQTRRGRATTVHYGAVSQTRAPTDYTGDMLVRCQP
jgi:hypothetical protein